MTQVNPGLERIQGPQIQRHAVLELLTGSVARPAWPPRPAASPTSRANYDRKRAQGKKHNAALVCLARRRIDPLHAMLKHDTLYEDRSTPAAA